MADQKTTGTQGASSTSHPNYATVRKGYEAFARRDMAAVRDLFAEDASVRVSGSSPLAGRHLGRDAITEMFSHMLDAMGESHKVDIDGILANDDYAVVLAHPTGTHKEKGVAGGESQVHVYRMRDGKAIKAWVITTDDYSVEEFWWQPT